MKISRTTWITVVFSLILTGCGEREFGDGQVRGILESQQTRLDGEQIALTKGQVDCGEQAELWETERVGEDREVARLTQKGRDLGFGDDVQVVDPSSTNPNVQLRGNFALSLLQINNIRDEGPQNKVVDAKFGVRINNACFDNPLPVLFGVKKGKFTDAVGAQMRFRLDGEWLYDQIVH